MKGESPSTLRKTSASREHRSNTSSSLEHELSAFFLRRARTSKSTANSEFHSSTASPTCKKPISRPVHRSAEDSVKSPGDVEVHVGSVRSSKSGASGHPLNVSDWNEQVVKKTRPGSIDSSTRHPIDPPRPPREGHEWVWFPEGYWAERERSSTSTKSARSKWYSFSPDRKSRRSSVSNQSKRPSKAPTPPKVILEGSETPSSTMSKSQVASESGSRDAQGNRILKGLQYLSPVYPHFVAPSGEREGLYCKARRSLGVAPKPKLRYQNDSCAGSEATLPSQTKVLLEGTSQHLRRHRGGRSSRRPTNVFGQASPEIRSRRRGLAPWHRRGSQSSLVSTTSSVHRMLMGGTPAATPASEEEPDGKYGGPEGRKFSKVEISEAAMPNYLPSVSPAIPGAEEFGMESTSGRFAEATQLPTPPISDETLRDFCFELTSPDESGKSTQGDSVGKPKVKPITGMKHPGDTRSPARWWEQNSAATKNAATARRRAERQLSQPRFELNLPEHLPNSPLCPKNPLHKSGGTGICVFHGRKRSNKLKLTETGDAAGSATSSPQARIGDKASIVEDSD